MFQALSYRSTHDFYGSFSQGCQEKSLPSSITLLISMILNGKLSNCQNGILSNCERFKEEGIVSPVHLRKGLFTIGALDNLDHNPSSTTKLES